MPAIQLNRIEKNMQFELDYFATEEDHTAFLFPGQDSHLQESIQMLQKYYRKDKHSHHLINYCYRCHQPAIFLPYNLFKDQHHPHLQEPPISKFYSNQKFIDLRELNHKLSNSQNPQQSQSNLEMAQSIRQILDELFATYDYIPHLERYLLQYPTYLQQKQILQQSLFEESKISKRAAYLLAFCAASELGCFYLMARYFKLFKHAGGDPGWINAGTFPQKYKLILGLNRLMARAIWEVKQNTITDILENNSAQWNQSELAHCIQILAYVHHLSAIVLAMGFNLQENAQDYQLPNFQKVIKAIETFQGSVTQEQKLQQELSQSLKEIVECTSPLKKRVNTEQQIKPYMRFIGLQLGRQQLYSQIQHLMPHVLAPYQIIKKRRQHVYPLVEQADYNFNFMAYPLLNSLTQSTADRLRGLIQHAQSMPEKGKLDAADSKGGNKSKQFRKAMTYYVQNLCGYRHMEYDYKAKVTTFLSMPLKFYIRLIMTSPAHIAQPVILEISNNNQDLDLGGIAILIASVKLSLELTLTMKAFQSA